MPAADKTDLEARIEAAEALDEKVYTAESWNTLQDALASAKKTAADEAAVQADVDAAADALKAAYEALVTAPEEVRSGYVLMNIPCADFYEAEGVSDVDSVSSATKSKTRNSGLAGGSYHVNSDGTDITGVTYPVYVEDLEQLAGKKQVTDEDSVEITVTNRGTTSTNVYEGKEALFENESYAYYVLDEEPAVYKELTVGEDGSFRFGKAQGAESERTAAAELLSGSETGYGDYQINIEDEELAAAEKIHAVVVHTKEGDSYGLRHVENIWRKTSLAWSTGHTTTTHGCTLSYEPYKKSEGQTVDTVTFYTPDSIVTITLDEEAALLPVAEIEAEAKSEKEAALTGLPEDLKGASAKITYKDGEGRGAKTVTLEEDLAVENGTVTLSSEVFEDGKNYTVTVISYNYSVMSAAFTYTKPEEPEEPEEPELIPAEEVSYQIIKGADSVWTKGSSEGLLIASDAPFEKFDSVLIDGEEADAANYEAVSGSTEVTLKPSRSNRPTEAPPPALR